MRPDAGGKPRSNAVAGLLAAVAIWDWQEIVAAVMTVPLKTNKGTRSPIFFGNFLRNAHFDISPYDY